MLPTRAFARGACAASLAASLAACSLLAGPWKQHVKPAPPPPPPAPPPAALPLATYKFELDPGEDVVGRVQLTTVGKDDTLTDIARRFNVGYEEIARANPGIDVWLPGAGREVVVPTQFVLPDAPHVGVVINIAAMRLYYFPPRKPGEKQIVYTHPIGIGRVGWRTPEGVTRIVRREKDPVWRVPPSILKEHHEEGDDLPAVVGPGPDNPLGRHAFYLAWPGYLIHGTNKPAGVGLRVSHGCIHLYPEDIASLFDLIPIGTTVRVVNQPFVFGWHEGELYMQAYGSLEDDPRNWHKARQRLLARVLGRRIDETLARSGEQVDWGLVGALADKPRGVPVAVTQSGASVAQVLASALKVQDVLPAGATWDGKLDAPMDEKTFREILSEGPQHTDTGDASSRATSESSPAPGSAPARKSGS
ncbi:MAG TPA: L,D-transpeptidase family protein [Steroidobacteraceae bacterium]|nr:L,D-transpeptidase family protein [Steroidobacteraceae bacterium]